MSARTPECIDQTRTFEREVRSTTKSLAPSVTLYGLREPHTLDIEPRKYSRMMRTRLEVERAIATFYRGRHRDLRTWTFSDGIYRQWEEDWDYGETINNQPLTESEAQIAKNIDALLDERSDTDKPVVAVDFGGGLGLSWLRIASQPKYKTAIEESRLAMVVTNLGSQPPLLRDEETGYSGVAQSMANTRHGTSYKKEDLDWAQSNQNHLHYLDANALELAVTYIILPNGTPMSLKNSVDIINENLALTHTHVPDLAMASFGTLLNAKGILYSEVATHYHLMHPAQFNVITLENGKKFHITEEYSYHRRLALAIGSKLLQGQGFSYSLSDKEFGIGVFKRLPNGLKEQDTTLKQTHQ